MMAADGATPESPPAAAPPAPPAEEPPKPADASAPAEGEKAGEKAGEGTGEETPASGAGTDDDDEFKFSFEKEGEPSVPDDESVSLTEEQIAELTAALRPGDGHDPEKAMTLALRTSRGRKMLEAFKSARELSKDPADGGLGFQPSTKEIVDAFADQLSYQDFYGDLTSGNPDKVLEVTRSLLRPGEDGRISTDILRSFELLPSAVRAVNPVAYERLIQIPAALDLAERFAAIAANDKLSEDQQKKYSYVANGIRILLTGSADAPAATPAPAAGDKRRPGRPSPRQDALEEENRRLREQLEQSSTRDQERIASAVDGELYAVADSLLNELLPDEVRGRFSEAVLAPWRRSQIAAIGASLSRDPRYAAEFERAFLAYAQQQSPDALGRVKGLYQSRAANYLRLNRKQILSDLAQGNGAAPARPAPDRDQRREPVSTGAPSNGASPSHSRSYQPPKRERPVSQADELMQQMQQDALTAV